VLNHRHIQLNRSLSHCVTQENHLEYHIISTLYIEEDNTLFHHHIHLCLATGTSNSMDLFFTALHRRIIWSITSSQLSTINPSHGLIPFSGEHSISVLERNQHPSHGHTQLMGFLTPHRGTQHSLSVSERNHTPNSWAFSQVDSLSLCNGGSLTQL
jgi:hypothetical protein